MDKDRRIAFLILKSVEEKGEWANLAAERLIAKEGASSPAFVRELAYGVLRNRTLLDYNINGFLKKAGLGLSERIWLRMGFYQLALMDGVEDYAAVNETVELAGKFKKGSEKFINAVLRNFQRSGGKLIYPPAESEEYLSVRYSVHRDIAELWTRVYDKDIAERLLSASNTPAPLSIRVNTLKTRREDIAEKLEALGFETKNSGISGCGLLVKGSGLLATRLYKEGYFSVQGESSQYAVSILDPKPGSTVIDLCAAPGGKTMAMAERMQGRGRILAFDLYEHRVKLIEKEAERLGIDIVETKTFDASEYAEELDSTADFVLADVPCSGLGTLRDNPEIKFRLPDVIDVQGKILENALKYVKPGGYVLYSTCTINPAENDEIIKNCSMADSNILKGVCDLERKYKAIASRQILTETNGPDGFYICLLQRSEN